jgi:hypothetical protein
VNQLRGTRLLIDGKIELGILEEKQKGRVQTLKLRLGERKRTWMKSTRS